MGNDAVTIAAIAMTGLFLTAVAWQLLALARTAVDRDKDLQARQLEQRLDDVETLHRAGDHRDAG